MALATQVVYIFKKLDSLHSAVMSAHLNNPTFLQEIYRLKYHCDVLYNEAVRLDQDIYSCRKHPILDQRIYEARRKMYLLDNEIGFVHGKFQHFKKMEFNCPHKQHTIFSSPSSASCSSSPGRTFVPDQQNVYSSSQSSVNSSFGSQSSQGSSSSLYLPW